MIISTQRLVRLELWLLVAYGLLNLGILLVLRPAPNADWVTAWWGLEHWGPDVYDHPWRWSPLLLPVMALVVAGGPLLLGVAHLLALVPLARLGEWTVGLVAFSAFFWVDLVVGNVFTFVAVAAAFALAGSRVGGLLYLALTMLMPRPIQIPLAVWLVWRRPDLRPAFVVLLLAQALAVVLSGYGPAWLASLVGSSELIEASFSLGPGRLFGAWWLLIGAPAAFLMVWRGPARLAALAGVVLSPYLLPQYLLLGVVAVPARSWLEPWLARARGRPRVAT